MSRLGTCKFFVASRLAYKAQRAGFYAQLNINDRPCYSWWMSFIIRWSHCFQLLMRVVNQVLPLALPIFEASHICHWERGDLCRRLPLQEAWINISLVSVPGNKNKKVESRPLIVTPALLLHLVKLIKMHQETSFLINNHSNNSGGTNERIRRRLKT